MANPIGNHAAAGVYSQEINLSAVIQSVATSVGAAVGYALRGPIVPTFITDYPSYKQYYGTSNTQTQGYLAISVRDYFANGGTGCWVNRAVSTANPPTYSGMMLQYIGSPAQVQFTPLAVANPNTINWATAAGASQPSQNLAYICGVGPGSWYGNVAVSVTSTNVSPPTGVQTSVLATGGQLAAGTYQYAVTALSANGETALSTVIPATVTSGSTNSVVISFNYVPGALGYKVYGRTTSPSLYLLGTVAQPGATPNPATGGLTVPTSVSFTDTGAINGTVAPPSQGATTIAQFTLNIYDTTTSSLATVETWPVTLLPTTNANNQQLEIASVINNNSKYIQVFNNTPNYYSTATGGTLPPAIPPLTAANMAAGVDGVSPADGDIVNAWNVFQDQNLYNITQLMNCGYSDASVQTAMITLAQTRKDCVAFCDVPSSQQSAINAVAYRLGNLPFNTDRGMLFTSDLQELDPDTNQLIWVPPSAAIAGIAAGADNNSGAGTSIAGPSYGTLANVVKLRYTYGTQQEEDMMAQVQVNYVINRQGIGVYLNEQKTMMTQLNALSFYPVRRMFDVLENSVKKAMYYYQGAPNILFTAQQIAAMVTQYLNTLVAANKINGFAVQIDNSPEVRSQGQILVYMAIEPTLPINQIGIVAIITPQGANFAQILASVTGSGTSSAG